MTATESSSIYCAHSHRVVLGFPNSRKGPVSCENGDPPNWGPRVTIFTGNWGPSHENGDPQCKIVLDIDCAAWL